MIWYEFTLQLDAKQYLLMYSTIDDLGLDTVTSSRKWTLDEAKSLVNNEDGNPKIIIWLQLCSWYGVILD